ncbi:MAG: hypothetical protein GF401_03580 [Chitinivibrionales bacterium]|nr:hypothetical protein [Chitinivibrionales bacterium]
MNVSVHAYRWYAQNYFTTSIVLLVSKLHRNVLRDTFSCDCCISGKGAEITTPP